MPDENAQNELLVEVMKLLQKFQPGGESGPIADRDDWEKRVRSHASPDLELLQELTRFDDLWRYFLENREKLGPEILSALKEMPRAFGAGAHSADARDQSETLGAHS